MPFLKQLGPGFVYALAVLGTGDLVSNAAAGASYGYSLIWAVALTALFRFVWISTSARYVLVTGESLLRGYARAGRGVIWLIILTIAVIAHFAAMTQIVMSGRGADLLLPLPTRWSPTLWSLFFALLGFSMIYWGGYRVIERFCKILVAVMGASLILIALVSRPDPLAIARGALLPTIPRSTGLYSSLFVVMALIGTGAGTTGDLTYAYFIREKGWRNLAALRRQRTDLIFGIASMLLLGSLLQIAAAATVRPLGLQLEQAEDLVRIFSEVQGTLGHLIFSLGLWGAAFSTLLGIITGYSLMLADLSGHLFPSLSRDPGADAGQLRRHPVYRFCTAFWMFSPLYVLWTGVTPVWLVLSVNALFALSIPVVTPVLLKITNDPKLMGRHTNGWLTNLILGLLILLALYLAWENILELWRRWERG